MENYTILTAVIMTIAGIFFAINAGKYAVGFIALMYLAKGIGGKSIFAESKAWLYLVITIAAVISSLLMIYVIYQQWTNIFGVDISFISVTPKI